MPNNETHVRFSIEKFGAENEKLIFAINSWIDAPVRKFRYNHRRTRHDVQTMMDACVAFGNVKDGILKWDERNKFIAKIVLHHLILDGIITLNEAKGVFNGITSRSWKLKHAPTLSENSTSRKGNEKIVI